MSFPSGFSVLGVNGMTQVRLTAKSIDEAYWLVAMLRANHYQVDPPTPIHEPDNVIPLQRKETA